MTVDRFKAACSATILAASAYTISFILSQVGGKQLHALIENVAKKLQIPVPKDVNKPTEEEERAVLAKFSVITGVSLPKKVNRFEDLSAQKQQAITEKMEKELDKLNIAKSEYVTPIFLLLAAKVSSFISMIASLGAAYQFTRYGLNRVATHA